MILVFLVSDLSDVGVPIAFNFMTGRRETYEMWWDIFHEAFENEKSGRVTKRGYYSFFFLFMHRVLKIARQLILAETQQEQPVTYPVTLAGFSARESSRSLEYCYV